MEKNIKKNPSREECQQIIKRILVTEVTNRGKNEHFKYPSDFMSYFQSLYPPSDALTKQVQRAVKAMDLPKDEHGYYIINKTSKQLEEEREIKHLLEIGNVSITDLSLLETVLLKTDSSVRSYLMHIFTSSKFLEEYFDTIVESNNGLIFFTRDKAQLLYILNTFLSH